MRPLPDSGAITDNMVDEKNSHEVCETYKYGVDGNDIVVGLSDNWQSFSEENGGGERCNPKNIIGTSLWRHICEWQTKQLYEVILQRVREHNHRATFSFRCDSPEKRRFLTLAVIPKDEASIAFESTIINTELREPVVLLNGGIKRSEEFLRICSMCKSHLRNGVGRGGDCCGILGFISKSGNAAIHTRSLPILF